MDFTELIEYNKLKTEFDEDNFLHLFEMFIIFKFPSIQQLEIKFDKKRIVWVKYKKDNIHTKALVQDEIDKLKKELTHYAQHK